jgi:hypothetical protein
MGGFAHFNKGMTSHNNIVNNEDKVKVWEEAAYNYFNVRIL